MPSRSLVSVIIPTLNEADTIGPTLQAVQAQTPPLEVIVVDGGSSDGTRTRARTLDASVYEAPRGRGRQLNRGAAVAEGTHLLFLHADTRLPAGALSHIRRTLSEPGVHAGTFQLQFDRPSPLLRLYAWCTRWPWIRICFGDRGLFVTRRAFTEVGGYPNWPLFEDLELAARLHERGGFRFLNTAVTTSARRFERNGAIRQQLRNLYLWLHYLRGTPPDQLAALYEYPEPG